MVEVNEKEMSKLLGYGRRDVFQMTFFFILHFNLVQDDDVKMPIVVCEGLRATQ